MGSVGDCYGNAASEAFHASIKKERIYRQSWPTRAEARAAVFEYIEGWYNPRRRHSTLGSPQLSTSNSTRHGSKRCSRERRRATAPSPASHQLRHVVHRRLGSRRWPTVNLKPRPPWAPPPARLRPPPGGRGPNGSPPASPLGSHGAGLADRNINYERQNVSSEPGAVHQQACRFDREAVAEVIAVRLVAALKPGSGGPLRPRATWAPVRRDQCDASFVSDSHQSRHIEHSSDATVRHARRLQQRARAPSCVGPEPALQLRGSPSS
jgi:hypothetical protein